MKCHAAILRSARYGFSLIEVVIAMGVVSFALMAMMGLLSMGLNNNRESTVDTNLALCTETVLTSLRTEGFSNVVKKSAYQPDNISPNFLFSSSGLLQQDGNGQPLKTQNSESYYSCLVTRRTPAVLDQATTNLIYLQLKFSWPMVAPIANRQTRIVVASLANYD